MLSKNWDTLKWTLKSRINSYELFQNYPNPFNPSTKIKFGIPKEEFVSIKLFNVLGQEIKVILEKVMKKGYHFVQFDAGNMATGSDFYTMDAGNRRLVKKMVILN